MTTPLLDFRVKRFIADHRVARLATADAQGRPHVIPICYVFDGQSIYSALDLKPKRVTAQQLKRVRNIVANPHVSLVIDDYSEAWDTLAYVLVQAKAKILENVEDQQRAESMLCKKYHQYTELLEKGCTIIKITPERVTSWGHLK